MLIAAAWAGSKLGQLPGRGRPLETAQTQAPRLSQRAARAARSSRRQPSPAARRGGRDPPAMCSHAAHGQGDHELI
jgi:hypothetical protein